MDAAPNPAPLYQPIARALGRFAEDHGLLMEPFRHDGASWDFLFRHPAGGSARLQVLPGHGDGYSLVATWTVNELPARRRMWKRSEMRSVAADPEAVHEQLENLLKEVLTWDGSSWSEIVAHYPFVPDDAIANTIARDARLPAPRFPDRDVSG